MDAECCCADANGVSDFNSLHSRRNDHNAFAYIFDLLVLEDADIRPLPLVSGESNLPSCCAKRSPVFD
jgi:ATP-dependent DNA ligase